jgi:Sulfotransferase family
MIISHRHRFVFFAIPKTGTHSIRQALRPHLAEDDLEQVGLFENRQFPFPELARLRHGHINVEQIRPALGAERFGVYFKFAFVRNPFDRYVSYCAFISRDSGQFSAAPRDFMKRVLTELRPIEHLLFRPQWEFISNADGQLAIDFVARFEHMQQHYREICSRLGIADAPLQRSNESGRGDYRDYYDEELKALVADAYGEDCRRFGYQFDGDVRA